MVSREVYWVDMARLWKQRGAAGTAFVRSGAKLVVSNCLGHLFVSLFVCFCNFVFFYTYLLFKVSSYQLTSSVTVPSFISDPIPLWGE